MTIEFTPLKVSTMTVTAMIFRSCNLVDLAKYQPLDDEVIGIRLVYGSGRQHIHRGSTGCSTKGKDVLNQVTLFVRLPPDHERLISCKIFHNGRFHITGCASLEEAQKTAQILVNKLYSLKGFSRIKLKTLDDTNILCSHDDLMFSASGECIGNIVFDDDNHIKKVNLKNEWVEPGEIRDVEGNKRKIFITQKWSKEKIKTMYTLSGDIIGIKRLEMDVDISKRHFDVNLGYVYVKDQIVGKELIEWVDKWENVVSQSDKQRAYMKSKGYIIHPYSGTADQCNSCPVVSKTDLDVDMINVGFKTSVYIANDKLHETFKRCDLISTYEPGRHLGCNLRYMYNQKTIGSKDEGKCVCKTIRMCTCKGVTVTCFPKGTISIKGLKIMDQADTVAQFMKRFYAEHHQEFTPV